MRQLAGLPGCTLLIRAPWPDRATGTIIPPPPPGWHAAVRAELGDWLAGECEDALQDRGAPVSVDVLLTDDESDGQHATVRWDDAHGTQEQVAALLRAVAVVLDQRAAAGLRFAKRAADRQHAAAVYA